MTANMALETQARPKEAEDAEDAAGGAGQLADGVLDVPARTPGIDGQEAGQLIDEAALDAAVLEHKTEDADGEDDKGKEREEDVVGDGGRHLRAVVIEELEDGVLGQQPQAPEREHRFHCRRGREREPTPGGTTRREVSG